MAEETNQFILIQIPGGDESIMMDSCITYFKGFHVSSTVHNDILRAYSVSLSMIPSFNTFTETQKTIIKSWEKMKISGLFNEYQKKLLGEGNFTPIVYTDIPDSYFT